MSNYEERKTYEDGLKDAWEAAKKIYFFNEDGGLISRDMMMIFGTGSIRAVFNEYSAKEAVEKIKTFEKEKEKIHVGDVVKHKNNEKVVLVVTTLHGEGSFSGIKITESDGFGELFDFYIKRNLDVFEKTGQHYDLNEIFNIK